MTAQPCLAAIAVVSLATIGCATPAPRDVAMADETVSRENRELHDNMRRLWSDHVSYTRLYIVSAVGNLADKAATTERLLRNQEDIGHAVGRYYGDAAGDSVTALLKAHILGAAAVLKAAQAKNKAALESSKTQLYQNGDSIAAYLSAANSAQWPLATLQGAFKTHLDQLLDEATARLEGRTADELSKFDASMDHILKVADLLSDGIVAQFPDKFASKALVHR